MPIGIVKTFLVPEWYKSGSYLAVLRSPTSHQWLQPSHEICPRKDVIGRVVPIASEYSVYGYTAALLN